MTDFDLILNPPREPALRLMAAIDRMSLRLPLVTAALSAFAGAAALMGVGPVAALLSLVAGCTAGAGAFFTNWAWKVRDNRHAVTHGLAGAAFVEAGNVSSRTSPQF